uniref:Uncharacterized protein n=1 Tax=Ditylenchus dipsaci TaxID=166011 RepID=A0A915E6Z4_9BILA
MNLGYFCVRPFDGILGMAWDAISVTNSSNHEPEFANSTEGQGGQLTLCDIDETHYTQKLVPSLGALSYKSVVESTKYSAILTGLPSIVFTLAGSPLNYFHRIM